MRGIERVKAQTHAGRSTRRKVLHQHVGAAYQLLEHGQCGGLLEVQRQAFLGAIDPDEMRGQTVYPLVIGTRKVANAGALDLDDARAQVSELAGTKRRGDGVFQRDDGNAVERSGLWAHQNDLGSPSKCSAT